MPLATRHGDGDGAPVFLPERRTTSTRRSPRSPSAPASVNHLDDTGSIEVGKLADLAIVDRDLFATRCRYRLARVDATFVEASEGVSRQRNGAG